MAKNTLTDTKIRNLKPRSERYEILEGRGFGVRVGTTGKVNFVMYYRTATGKHRRLTLGEYPELQLGAARTLFEQHKAALKAGVDPADEVLTARLKRSTNPTLTEFWQQTFDPEHVATRLRPRTMAQYRDTFRLHIEPSLGKIQVQSIDRADVRKLHAQIGATGQQRTANIALAILRCMLNHALDLGLLEGANPASRIRPFAETPRERYLSAEEIGRLYSALEADAIERQDWTWHDLIKVLLLTGARRGNVLSMRWQDVDLLLGRWLIPSSQAKTGRLYVVSLPPGAVQILKRRRQETPEGVYVFPGRTKRTGPEKGQVQHLVEVKAAWERIRRRADLRDARIHDLRHTTASLMANTGASLQVIGSQLGHTRADTTARYSHLLSETVAIAVTRATAALGSTSSIENEREAE